MISFKIIHYNYSEYNYESRVYRLRNLKMCTPSPRQIQKKEKRDKRYQRDNQTHKSKIN